MNKVDLALAYAARGWKVLALQPNSKIPLKSALQEHGSKDATDNPNTIRILWGEYPNANVGIATGEASGLTVLDLDDRTTARANVEALPGFKHPPPTYGVKTPRGWHLYYRFDSSISQSAGRVEKVDIRNNGGYVVAAGSEVDGVTYEALNDLPVAAWDFPPIFKNGYQANRPTVKNWVAELQGSGALEGNRNDRLFRLAAAYRQMGHEAEEMQMLLDEANAKNNPSIVASAMRYDAGKKLQYSGKLVDPPMVESQTDRRTTFYWAEPDIRVELSKIDRRGSRAYAKMRVWTGKRGMIYMASVSLYDQRSRKEIIDYLMQQHPLADWNSILHQIAATVDSHSEKPGVTIDLARHVPKNDSPYLIFPLVRQNQSTVLYANGGSGKSTFALAVAATGATQKSFIPGISNTAGRPIKTLYLDWEAGDDDVASMLKELSRGAQQKIPDNHIHYQSMSGAFIDHCDELVEIIVDNGIELIIVDSLVASAGGDVNDAEAARLFHNSVRSLNVASIAITHTNKSDTLFGSQFFWNLSRQVFRLTSISEPETNPVLGLYHEKSNRSKLIAPVAYDVEFSGSTEADNASIRYVAKDIQSVPELAKGTGLRERLIGLLRNGSMTVEQLAERTGADQTQILATMERMSGTFSRAGGTSNAWTLSSES
jgi:hypothetical protein